MKRLLTICTAVSIFLESFGMLSVSAEKSHNYIYMDISKYYNATLYADKDVALGKDKGSCLYFPGTCSASYSPQNSVGTAIEKSDFEKKLSEEILTSSQNSKFKVDASGAVIMGSNGFGEWELPIDNKPYGIDILSFATYPTECEGFSIQVYYADGTVEEDHALKVNAFNVDSGNSVSVKTLNPSTGKILSDKYANVISIDLKNQYTELKTVEKIVITHKTGYVSTAYMAVTLDMTPCEYDFSGSVPADISKYCNGEYMSSYDDLLQHKYSGFLYNSTEHINYDYVEKYTDENNRFYYDGTVYKFAEKNQIYKGIYSYIEDDYEIAVPLEENYYEKICMMVNAVSYPGEKASGTHPKITDVPVTIDYADGTSSETTIDVGYARVRAYYSNGGKEAAPAIIAGSILNNIDWGGTSELTSKTVTAPDKFSSGFIYAVEVPTDAAKAAVKIRIGSENKRLYLYALTGVKRETTVDLVNFAISDLISQKPVYDTMYSDIKMIRSLIDDLNAEEKIENYDKFTAIEEELNSRLKDKGYLEIFVSPKGNDKDCASENSPIKTFKKAKDFVDKNRSALKLGINIHVVFDDGEYINEKGFTLNAADGTDVGKIIYKGKNGNTAFTNATELNKSDFSKVTDSSVLEKLPDSAKNKVYSLDLDKYSVSLPEYNKITAPILLADNQAQEIAKYPNDGYTSVKANVEKADYPESYPYTEYTRVELYNEQHSDWSGAKYAYAEGYFAYDYNYMKIPVAAYESDTNILTVGDKKSESASPAINTERYPTKPRRIRIVNLIEELDAPGEWYYDKDENMIYWYPENFEDIQNVKVTTNENAVISVNGADKVSFENIKIFASGGDGIKIFDVSGVDIKDCEMSDISQRAVSAENCKDTLIKSNEICDSAMGIVLKSGDFEKLTSCGNVITDNHIYNIGYGKQYGRTAAINLNDTGCEVSHNTIHDMPDSAIRYLGNDNKIVYNEIYNVCSEVNDASAIYSGRKYIERGTEIAYNYIHDLTPNYNWNEGNEREGDDFIWCYGIYFDDGLCGQKAYKNILVNIPSAFNINCGQQNEIYDNTIVNITSNTVFYVTSYAMGNADRIVREKEEWEGLSAEQQKIYSSKYEGISEGYITYPASPAKNTVINNLLADCSGNISVTKENIANGGIFENNISKDNADFFYNKTFSDYRIKAASSILKELTGLLNETNIKITDFGTSLIDKDVLIFKDASGEKTENWGNENMTLAAYVTGTDNGECYAAFYEKDGRLIGVKKADFVNDMALIKFNAENADRLKVFSWERNTQKPIKEAKIIVK